MHVDDSRALGAVVVRFLQNGLAVLAGLAEVDVNRVTFIALILQPAQNDGSIEAAGVCEDAGRHGVVE